uniref:Uncharacterized protein n=1 Tax=Solanum tuberosum TaxID=4113 RepID=M1C4L1_SOLTU
MTKLRSISRAVKKGLAHGAGPTQPVIGAAKEFSTELIMEHDASAQPPVENAIEGSQEEKQDTKVSSTEERS